MSKLRPTLFLNAAKFIKRQLKWYPDGYCNGYAPGCMALREVARVAIYRTLPEYRLFYKLFNNKRGKDMFWFGEPDCWDSDSNNYLPKVKNQEKRIKALLKCYKLAGGKRSYNLKKLGV